MCGDWGKTETYIHLPELFLVLLAPGKSLDNAAISQSILNLAHLNEYLNVDEVFNLFLVCESTGAVVVAVTEEIVHEQPIESLAAPGLILDVVVAMHSVELAKMGDTSGGLVIEACLFVGVSGKLAFDTSHFRYHGVEVLENIFLGGAAIDGGGSGLLEKRFDRCAVLLDGKVGCSEVVAHEFIGET